ncbi:SprT-like family-domain-containing protein [Crassisporium funariophilum]|nr:SprT-like family-domain-containing protein [Crassisporium funariophilum]
MLVKLTKPDIRRGKIPEVIPDSEEDRVGYTNGDGTRAQSLGKVVEVIEISSSEDESVENFGARAQPLSRTPRTPINSSKKGAKRPLVSRRRIIESSEEESDDSGVEIIEITNDSIKVTLVEASATEFGRNESARTPSPPIHSNDDGAIIVFDEPRHARTPLHIGIQKSVRKPTSERSGSIPSVTHQDSQGSTLQGLSSSRALPPTRGPSTPTSQRLTGKAPASTPRTTSKNAKLAAEQQKRHEFAQRLFIDLNKAVFKNGLPEDTQLNWNKRLLTTAGRAKWHRSREGIQTTQIELAEKILDCEERIRNTLSHEMCHLATWIIDQEINEHHGKIFKRWASLVERKRPDIHVSIKHDYEISYPYEWKCEKCAKIYGRFSKSIKPNECVCGACKEGRLVPLFTAKRQPKAQNLSRMAATKSQDSPRSLAPSVIGTLEDTVSSSKGYLSCEASDSLYDSDSDIEGLVKVMASTSLTVK